ncbi:MULTISPECIES: histidine phosphotransferase family protein [Sphingomonas]|jgi:histidine phosphotransferase ChpT|uniref:Histidine phosphotransferase n=1 Tax=Sphingomonas adhaesiva TaxID=28212 RepID=A0A2A4IAJ9_9SPHN|nr:MULTISPECIES: histidine phosphotransferase family protein [Sphingomonas]PCG15539.1 histidine phosphotransferase [Sphingomonas adhaesiva]PZU75617.1 MAG: histidine phosphotransferase [Sphingomonas sp.]
MTISPVDFASLLCSRLCHDLLSPIGAMSNGLELLADETDPAMRTRCLELLSESARASANKLKFFRLAFGAAGGFGDRVDMREARGAVEGLLAENKRLTLHWAVEEPELPKAAVKVLLNLALIAGDTLVRGGTVTIGTEEGEHTTEIVLRAEGPRVILDPDLRATLTDGSGGESVTPRAAAAFLVHAIVADAGGSVMVTDPVDNTLLFGATLPSRLA